MARGRAGSKEYPSKPDGFRISLYFRPEDRELHRNASTEARRRRMSLSSWICEAIAAYLEHSRKLGGTK